VGKTSNEQSTDYRRRRRAYEAEAFAWHLGKVPESLRVGDIEIRPHPARKSIVFVVHGIGRQNHSETAAQLRSGFEDALLRIRQWQDKQNKKGVPTPTTGDVFVPPPYIREGYWADYPDIEKTFEEDIKPFSPNAREFFAGLWKIRILSTLTTYGWFLKQQLRLLNPAVIFRVGPLAYLFYWPLQIFAGVTLTLMVLRGKQIIRDFLSDVRMYADPRGVTERAIVQRIDYRVGQSFLKTIGLDWDFRKLKGDQRLTASGEIVEFDRIIWVAHSLGTVISYNVLSDLFHRAEEIEQAAGKNPVAYEEQLKGIKHFRTTLKKFITMGSPLDKFAFLFGRQALSPWPARSHASLLSVDGQDKGKEGWWVNFYHFLDPVSGSLESDMICRDDSPRNHHIGFWHLPGVAHMGYWTDHRPLRFILGRTFGQAALPDREFKTRPRWVHTLWALGSQVFALSFTGLVILGVIALAGADWAGKVLKTLLPFLL
jgi:hypothetical protein